MEKIEYKYTHDFNRKELERLFLSVDWESGRYPDKLVEAMKGYPTVISAWHGDRLVGMACTMDDKVMTAYVHYVLVDPAYQGYGIGGKLVELTKERYADYLRILLVAYPDKIPFYEKYGFKNETETRAMYLDKM